jgi:peptidoglycan/LPS O-acetylase OafA/YrhL
MEFARARMNDLPFRTADSSANDSTANSGQTSVRRHDSQPMPGNLKIPSLDGIRAVSFFLVFFSHAGFGDVVPGGFGVGIFFLLSGFLITTLLRTEFARDRRISLGHFYLRRVLRILPPLYIALLLAAVLTLVGGGRSAIPLPGTLAQVLQVANYYQVWASDPRIMPGSGVLWSLAVEEHFYLIFPLLYVWMASRFSRRRQSVLLLALCAAGLAWRCVLHFHFHADAIRTNFGTDTRFDSILLANPVLHDPLHESLVRQMKWLLPLSIALLLGTFLYRSEGFRETLRYTLQGLALIPLFIAAIRYQQSWPVRFLNLPWVRFLGVLSYTLYLCHSMFLEGVRSFWPSTSPVLVIVVSLVCAMGFAVAVHYFIELPCARLRKRLSKSPQVLPVPVR